MLAKEYPRSAHDLAVGLYERRRERDGGDADSTRRAATVLAEALRDLGRGEEARELDE